MARSLRQRSCAKSQEVVAEKGPWVCASNPQDGDETVVSTRHTISLSNTGSLAKLCCCIPGIMLFGNMLVLVVCCMFFQSAFYWITAAFSVYTLLWSGNLAISCAAGAYLMRKEVTVDWSGKLKELQVENPEASAVMHIILLPNYKEDQDMMLETLLNLARSSMARSMHIVLAMEAREGQVAKDRAAFLIDATRHLFADIFATFHVDAPGDVPGKSSNCQWAYREVWKRYAQKLNTHDVSKVFITCGDADLLFHPQYFSALAYKALCMPVEKRVWSIWQPPVLLLRNLYSCPSATRLSGYGTILFELGGLANERLSPHFSFASYSCTLALAMNKFVDGWDRDVIAEDHHMFCKCFFASIWEQLDAPSGKGDKRVQSDLRLMPIYLPAMGFMVESASGWAASISARFVQARRHSQGIAELSYALLQYAELLSSGHSSNLTLSGHQRVWGIIVKMTSVHILNNLYVFGFVLAVLLLAPQAIQWVLSHGVSELLQTMMSHGAESVLSLQSLGGLKWAVGTIFGPTVPLSLLLMGTVYLVVQDTLENRLTTDPAKVQDPAVPLLQGAAADPIGLGAWGRFKLMVLLENDYLSGALVTMLLYGITPAVMATFSLFFKNGAGFQYVVALKPNTRS